MENTEQAREAPRRSRRHFVAAGAAAAAAAMAGFASSKDAEAAAGDPLVLGADGSVNSAGTAQTDPVANVTPGGGKRNHPCQC